MPLAAFWLSGDEVLRNPFSNYLQAEFTLNLYHLNKFANHTAGKSTTKQPQYFSAFRQPATKIPDIVAPVWYKPSIKVHRTFDRYLRRGTINSKFALPSSARTFLKKSQSIQESIRAANSPMVAPSPQKVPATAQQIRPPFFPKFRPFSEVSSVAGHPLLPATFAPSGSLPHFLNSQQFCLGFIRLFVSRFIFVPPFLLGSSHK
jgi:hypothetical protein